MRVLFYISVLMFVSCQKQEVNTINYSIDHNNTAEIYYRFNKSNDFIKLESYFDSVEVVPKNNYKNVRRLYLRITTDPTTYTFVDAKITVNDKILDYKLIEGDNICSHSDLILRVNF